MGISFLHNVFIHIYSLNAFYNRRLNLSVNRFGKLIVVITVMLLSTKSSKNSNTLKHWISINVLYCWVKKKWSLIFFSLTGEHVKNKVLAEPWNANIISNIFSACVLCFSCFKVQTQICRSTWFKKLIWCIEGSQMHKKCANITS